MSAAFTVKRSDRAASACCVGDIVYRLAKYDYSMASEDSRLTGVEHVSVTREADGDYPFFTIPKCDLEAATPLPTPPAEEA